MEEIHKKVVRDPIYGYIGLTEDQLKVISLPVFQRLRRISQLSFADFVYPNATHTRFSHSLGVLELARRVASYIEKLKMDDEVKPEHLEALKWAGLLHDIGHFPFSHVFEPVATILVEGENSNRENFHVRWGKEIINNSKFMIKEIVGDDMMDIISVLASKDSDRSSIVPPIVKDYLTWIFSIDRLDYLKRDAYHAGTPEYAIIDSDRVINSVMKDKHGRHYIHKKKCLQALEGVVLSYFYMYRAIYFHHTVRAAYLAFQDILWDACIEGNYLNDVDWEDIDDNFWISFDDHRCLVELSNINEEDGIKKKLGKFLNRELPKVIEESELGDRKCIEILNFCNNVNYQDKMQKEREMLESLRNGGFSLSVLFLDSPFFVPYPSPFSGKHAFIQNKEDQSNPKPFYEEAPYVEELVKSCEKARVYVDPFWQDDTAEKSRFLEGLKSEILRLNS